jgi:dsRNA-specific ribonuclease
MESIYNGPRDHTFTNMISSILKRGNISSKDIKMLTSPKNLEEFSKAFTSETADSDNNYEFYEQIGDSCVNHFLITYMYRRFPILKCAKGVKVVARLKIKYGSKDVFYKIAYDLGFWEFISASDLERSKNMKSLLEDVFEAFIGCIEYILNTSHVEGVGYGVVYAILSNIFDSIPISLSYENLHDAKTRLKEIFDFYKEKIGKLVYEEERVELLNTTTIYRNYNGKKIVLGKGISSLAADSQQKAALVAIETLKKQNFVKEIPEIYKKLL